MRATAIPIFRDNDLYVDFNMVASQAIRGACARLSIGCASTCVHRRTIRVP